MQPDLNKVIFSGFKPYFTANREWVDPFDSIEWKTVDAEIRKADGSVAFSQKGVEVPSWWSQTTINIVADKYLRVIDGVKETSVKQMFSRVTRTLANWAWEQNYFQSAEEREIYEKELRFALVHQFGAFNSPVWFNIGIPNRRQAASACFISGVEDSLDSIMNFQKSEATIFAGGSGSGANLSYIRSSYEKLSSGSYTSGPMSWMRGLDQYAMAMKSGGSTRNAAKMVVIDMDHPDILQTKDGRAGFIRSKAEQEVLAHELVSIGYSTAYDDPNGAYKRVMYQNANHSVSVPDSFMEAVVNDGDWSTKSRLDGTSVTTYRARDLWREIAKAAWVCGDPGVQFTDIINSWHTVPNAGKIRASNPCSEFLHVDNTACNLAAVNLSRVFDGREFKVNDFIQVVRLLSTAQMAIVAMADYPTEAIDANSKKLRPIGINYGDLGAILMKLGYSYDSNEGRAVAARLASLMTGLTYLNSTYIAHRSGAFSAFPENRTEMLGVMHRHHDADASICDNWSVAQCPIGQSEFSRLVWNQVIEKGEIHGFNISQASLQAPLGTISFLMGMSTTGIEPAFSLVSYKSMVGGGYMKLVNSSVEEALRNLGYSQDEVKTIADYVVASDCIEGAPGLKSEHLPVFDCAMPSGPSGRYLSPESHIKMMAAIQPLITCAQSKTVNLPSTATVEDIENIYMMAWRMGVKCVALYRDGCKASQPLAAKKEEKKAEPVAVNPVQESMFEASDEPAEAIRNRLPDDINGHRHRFEINGFKGYIVVNEYDDGRPGEVFLKLGKPGSTISGLIDGFTQLLSIALQYGVPLPKLINSFIDTSFEPSGMTSNKKIRFTKSIYDYLFKYLDVKYEGGVNSGLAERIAMIEEAEAKKPKQAISTRKMTAIKSLSEKNSETKPKKSLSTPPCLRCGNFTQKNGSCYVCTSCGTTTGCS